MCAGVAGDCEWDDFDVFVGVFFTEAFFEEVGVGFFCGVELQGLVGFVGDGDAVAEGDGIAHGEDAESLFWGEGAVHAEALWVGGDDGEVPELLVEVWFEPPEEVGVELEHSGGVVALCVYAELWCGDE